MCFVEFRLLTSTFRKYRTLLDLLLAIIRKPDKSSWKHVDCQTDQVKKFLLSEIPTFLYDL